MLFLIPARAGSTRLPGKNKRLFCGLPLWMWSYATAMRVKSEGDSVMVSTDDPAIFATALTMDVIASCRPPHLCGDDSSTQSLIDWVFGDFQCRDSICLLQPTSPTREDGLVRKVISIGRQARTTTHGVANGEVYVYYYGVAGWENVESRYGTDIDTQSDFDHANEVMQAMRFR